MAGFEHGQRVAWTGYSGVWLVVGPDPCGPMVVIRSEYDSALRYASPHNLRPVPDTVTVTVEVPVDEAEAFIAWTDDDVVDLNTSPSPVNKFFAHCRAAVVEAMAARGGEGR